MKSHTETHADVGDKANDAVRVDGRDLRCRSVGEGGNLGLTQLGRVEYALARRPHQHRRDRQQRRRRHQRPRGQHQDPARRVGARGRDDRVGPQRAAGEHDRRSREPRAARQLPPEPRRSTTRRPKSASDGRRARRASSASLESAGHLDREVERLPSDEELAERHNTGLGLTVPELVGTARLRQDHDRRTSCSHTTLPEDTDFLPELVRYFPTAVRDAFPRSASAPTRCAARSSRPGS